MNRIDNHNADLDSWFMDDAEYLATYDADVEAAAAAADHGVAAAIFNALLAAPAAAIALMIWGN